LVLVVVGGGGTGITLVSGAVVGTTVVGGVVVGGGAGVAVVVVVGAGVGTVDVGALVVVMLLLLPETPGRPGAPAPGAVWAAAPGIDAPRRHSAAAAATRKGR